jgi:hypothetical protein
MARRKIDASEETTVVIEVPATTTPEATPEAVTPVAADTAPTATAKRQEPAPAAVAPNRAISPREASVIASLRNAHPAHVAHGGGSVALDLGHRAVINCRCGDVLYVKFRDPQPGEAR